MLIDHVFNDSDAFALIFPVLIGIVIACVLWVGWKLLELVVN